MFYYFLTAINCAALGYIYYNFKYPASGTKDLIEAINYINERL